jgi:predicted MFS family arabinose efflux permease
MSETQLSITTLQAAGMQKEKLSANVEELSVRRKWIILLAVSLITAVEISNRLSVNVLLPDMQGNVAANADEISWVLTLYNIGFICSMALSSGMRRILGARRHFLVSIALYSIGAIGCFLSEHSLSLLLTSRVVMGFGGGSFLVRMVVLSAAFFPGTSSRKPMTYALLILFGAQIFYPMAMGKIDDTFHWNYAFLIDFPFLLVGTFFIWKYMPPGHLFERGHRLKFDYRGTFLLLLSMFTLQTALSRGERDMWLQSPRIAICLAVGVISLIFFLIWEMHPRNDQPVLHLRSVLESHNLRTSFLLVMVLGATMGTALFILPQYLRAVQSFSATQTGEMFGFYALGLCLGGLLTLRVLIPRWGGLFATLFGFVLEILIFGFSMNLWTPDTPTLVLRWIIGSQGFALGPLWFGVANMAVAGIDLPRISEAEATYYFVRQLGNSFGVTAAAVIYDRRLTLHSSRLLDTANRLDPTVTRYLSAFAGTVHRNGGPGSVPNLGALQIFQQIVDVQSKLLSFVDISYCLGILCVVGVLLALTSRERVRRVLHHVHLW